MCRSTTSAIRSSSYLAPEYKAWCEQNEIEFTLSSWQGVDNDGTVARYSLAERTFFEAVAPSHRKQANELVFMDCRYDVTLDTPVTRVLMADVLTLTGRIRNLSPAVWPVGCGPGRWSVAGYLTRLGRRKQWVRSCAPAPRTVRCRRTANWSSPCRSTPAACRPVSTRCGSTCYGPAKLDGATGRFRSLPPSGSRRFSHEIAVDADAVTLPPGGTAVLSGTLRNTCNKPWPEGAGGEPLKLGARLFRRSGKGDVVREFRALLEGLPETPEDAVAFRLVLDPGELQRGDYELSIDVVKENQFWLAEKGTTPRVIPVVIA